MRLLLLFDQNLSYRLVDRLADIYPGSTHVRPEGLSEADDHEVWEFARSNGYTIVSQDGDFFDMSVLNGAPPKVIWLTCGNSSTSFIERILRENYDEIEDFVYNQPEACLELS